MMTMTTNYLIKELATGDVLGECDLTDEQFCRYMDISLERKGLVAMTEIPGQIELPIVTDGNTYVYLD